MQIPLTRGTFMTPAPSSPFLIYSPCLLQEVLLTAETFALLSA